MSTDTSISPIIPDFSKIASYSPADNYQHRETTIRSYRNGEKELLYINASHILDSNNPTCDKIREAIKSFRPQRVVVEGRPEGLHGEAAFAESLCKKHGIPVVYGEPDDTLIFEEMKNTPYSIKDVMALYLLRTIPQDRQMGRKMDEANFAQRAERFLSRHPAFACIAPEDRLTYPEFKEKYADKLPGKSFLDAIPDDFAPYLTENATYFQKLHGTISQIREPLINKTVAETLNEPDVSTTLVIYGGAHRVKSEPMWEAALGKGMDITSPTLEHAKRQFVTLPVADLSAIAERSARQILLPMQEQFKTIISGRTNGKERHTPNQSFAEMIKVERTASKNRSI